MHFAPRNPHEQERAFLPTWVLAGHLYTYDAAGNRLRQGSNSRQNCNSVRMGNYQVDTKHIFGSHSGGGHTRTSYGLSWKAKQLIWRQIDCYQDLMAA